MAKPNLKLVKGKGGMLRAHDSYLFHDKHPLIDILRTKMQDERVTYEMMSRKTGVSTGTLVRWFDGSTRSPHAVTLNQVAGYFGLKLDFNNVEMSERDRRSWESWKKNDKTTWKEWFDK